MGRGRGATGRIVRRRDLKPKPEPTDAELLTQAKRAATRWARSRSGQVSQGSERSERSERSGERQRPLTDRNPDRPTLD